MKTETESKVPTRQVAAVKVEFLCAGGETG